MCKITQGSPCERSRASVTAVFLSEHFKGELFVTVIKKEISAVVASLS